MYSTRDWLNPVDHPSTGTVAAYCGPSNWLNGKGQPELTTFLEVGDCHTKIRLHKGQTDDFPSFIKKMETLRDAVDNFVQYLKTVEEPAPTSERQLLTEIKTLMGRWSSSSDEPA